MQRNISIKVVVASESDTCNHEVEVLQSIMQNGDPSHPGHRHVSQLLDSFHLEGPNGRHLCIVTELLGPCVSSVAEQSRNFRLDGHVARQVSRQLLYATNYLHSCGVAHGGKLVGN